MQLSEMQGAGRVRFSIKMNKLPKYVVGIACSKYWLLKPEGVSLVKMHKLTCNN